MLKEAVCDFTYTGEQFALLDSPQVGRWSFRRTTKKCLCNWRLIVMMAAVCSSETSVSTYLRTRCQTPQDCHLVIMSDVTQIQEVLTKPHLSMLPHVKEDCRY